MQRFPLKPYRYVVVKDAGCLGSLSASHEVSKFFSETFLHIVLLEVGALLRFSEVVHHLCT